MTVREAYSIYQTPIALQNHMLGVASLAKILLEHWTGQPLHIDEIIKACTIHDIAKPMIFDLSKQKQYGISDDEIHKLELFQTELKQKFGEHEHTATIGICKEIGCSEEIVTYVDHLEWEYIPRWLETQDWASLIPIYADMKMGPKGIMPLDERLAEIKNRVGNDDAEEDEKNGKLLEKTLNEFVSLDIPSITNEQVTSNFDFLMSLDLS